MLAVVKTYNAVGVLARHHQASLLKLVSVSEANKFSLGKAKKVDLLHFMLNLESKMLIVVLFQLECVVIKIRTCSRLSLHHVLEGLCRMVSYLKSGVRSVLFESLWFEKLLHLLGTHGCVNLCRGHNLRVGRATAHSQDLIHTSLTRLLSTLFS